MVPSLALDPPLVAVAETPTNFLQYQLEKLAMNCVINSLTVLLNCKNGELLHNYNITRAMRLLLLEVSAVIRALPARGPRDQHAVCSREAQEYGCESGAAHGKEYQLDAGGCAACEEDGG